MPNFLQHEGAPLKIVGYATIFNTPIKIGGQTEVIAAGCFAPTLQRGAIDVRATVNHRREGTWASVRDGSLRLWQDDTGLAFDAAIPNTIEGRGLVRAVADGLIVASILFRPFQSKPMSGGYTVEAATLIDVCLATSAAYPTATWLVPFESMNHMPDHALLLRRRLIGGQIKAQREARDRATQPSVAPSRPARGAPSRAELAARACREANARRLANVALSRTPPRGTRRAA